MNIRHTHWIVFASKQNISSFIDSLQSTVLTEDAALDNFLPVNPMSTRFLTIGTVAIVIFFCIVIVARLNGWAFYKSLIICDISFFIFWALLTIKMCLRMTQLTPSGSFIFLLIIFIQVVNISYIAHFYKKYGKR